MIGFLIRLLFREKPETQQMRSRYRVTLDMTKVRPGMAEGGTSRRVSGAGSGSGGGCVMARVSLYGCHSSGRIVTKRRTVSRPAGHASRR